jgi:hypothetical protein
LKQLVDQVGGFTQAEADTGTPRSHLSAIVAGRRGMGDSLAAKLEQHYGKPAGWFDQGEGHWPFPRIDLQRVLRLSEKDLSYVEGRLAAALEVLEHTSHPDAIPERVTRPYAPGKGADTQLSTGRFPGEIDLRTDREQGVGSGVQADRPAEGSQGGNRRRRRGAA